MFPLLVSLSVEMLGDQVASGKKTPKSQEGIPANVRGGENFDLRPLFPFSPFLFVWDAVVTVRHYGSGLDTEWTHSGQASPRPADSTGSVTAWGPDLARGSTGTVDQLAVSRSRKKIIRRFKSTFWERHYFR